MCYFHTGSSFFKLFPFQQLFLSACLFCCSFCMLLFWRRDPGYGGRGGGTGLEESDSGKSFYLFFEEFKHII